MAEEEKNQNANMQENAQSTLETGTVRDNKPTSKEQNNTISSTKESKPKKKRKPFDIRVDSQNSLKESKNKFKNTYSTESLK